jgi:hypothetical protein
MKRQGICGALVFHAGIGETPWKTEFMSPPWRDLFRFAVEEAAKRQIAITLNVCAGWNAGGPWVTPEDAAKELLHAKLQVAGPTAVRQPLPTPTKGALTSQWDVAVLAWRVRGADAPCQSEAWVDLTDKVRDGELAWDAPAGTWQIVRFGAAIPAKAHTKCTGGGPEYPEIDPLSAEAMDKHFDATAGVLIGDVKPHVGQTFTHVHIDSGEIGEPDWTPKFREQFRRLRGYDPFPFLAAKAGLTVDDPATTERLLEDYDRTIADLYVECYYGRLAQRAREHGLGAHSRRGGFACLPVWRDSGITRLYSQAPCERSSSRNHGADAWTCH